MAPDYFGSIEAGDTKFNCIVANDVLHRARIPTMSPQETLAQVIAFFRECALPLRAIDVWASGSCPALAVLITSTPKPALRNTDFVSAIHRALNVPVAFDTDANAAALCVGCGATRSSAIPSARGSAAGWLVAG